MIIGKADILGIIFDMDGTLLDSMPEWKKTAEAMLNRYGIIPDSEDYERFMKSTAFDVGEYLIKRYSLKKTASELAEEIDSLIESAYAFRIRPKEHTVETLDCLKKMGVKMAAATATDRHLAESAFVRTGIMPYLEGIVSCADIGAGKSEPDVYYAAMKLLNIKKENTAVVEDALYAVSTAKKVGFFVIGIKDASMLDDEAKIKETADLYISSAEELYFGGAMN